jgi:hypothetical protein
LNRKNATAASKAKASAAPVRASDDQKSEPDRSRQGKVIKREEKNNAREVRIAGEEEGALEGI